MFNRYEILTAKYKKEILGWNWKAIKQQALCNCIVDSDDNVLGSFYAGSVLSIMPSGKFYTFWTSNQTRSDVTKDECFLSALETVALANDMFIGSSEGDSDSILLQCFVSQENAKCFVTDEDREKALEIFANQ